MSQAQRDGATVAEALDIGQSGDWLAAQDFVSASDPLVQDIVLWRKLRSGNGSLDEYNGYVARRGDWPGGESLARVMFNESRPRASASLTGQARADWREFSRLFRGRQYESAESFLIQVSTGPDALGEPGVWADRRLSLARRAAREGRSIKPPTIWRQITS